MPTTAEVVIEFEVDMAKTVMEGPLGEYTGYYTPASLKPQYDAPASSASPVWRSAQKMREFLSSPSTLPSSIDAMLRHLGIAA